MQIRVALGTLGALAMMSGTVLAQSPVFVGPINPGSIPRSVFGGMAAGRPAIAVPQFGSSLAPSPHVGHHQKVISGGTTVLVPTLRGVRVVSESSHSRRTGVTPDGRFGATVGPVIWVDVPYNQISTASAPPTSVGSTETWDWRRYSRRVPGVAIGMSKADVLTHLGQPRMTIPGRRGELLIFAETTLIIEDGAVAVVRCACGGSGLNRQTDLGGIGSGVTESPMQRSWNDFSGEIPTKLSRKRKP